MVIGITGSFCSGKSLVAKIFKENRAMLIDLDKLAHKYLKLRTATANKIIKEFGKGVVGNNYINRQRLASVVFGNKTKLEKLNKIIHPCVIKDMLGLINKYENKYEFLVVEAPLLFEAGLKKYFDYIIVVKAKRDAQVRRAQNKFRLKKEDVLRRISKQWPLVRKMRQADFIIDNNGSIRATRNQVKNIIKKLENN